ncbi:glycosyl transferase [Geomonas sp. Red276]
MKFFRDEAASAFRDLGVLLIGFGVLFFQFLGRLPLIDPDEGRYIEIPREMLVRGDFVTPILNHVKYFEKPPLHYWLNVISLKIFGESELAARVPGTLCGLLTVLLTYWVGRRLFSRRSGLLAAIILGTSVGFVIQSRINFTDMTLTFCLTGAFIFFMLAAREGYPRQGLHYYLFYAFMGLAVLAKGLIGIVLPGAVIFMYMLLTRRWRLLKEMRIPTGTIVFLAVCAPWFVLVSLRNPEFAHFFFIHEHFERFLTKVHHRYQPLWFFVPVLLGTMLPWSLFIPAALKSGWRERKSDPEKLFLFLWAVIIFAFFSKSNSKLIPYILPVFPPLALLIGDWFVKVWNAPSIRRVSMATAGLLILIGAGAIAYPLTFRHPEIGTTAGIVVGALFLGQGIVCLIAGRKGDPAGFIVPLAAATFVVIAGAPPYIYEQVAVKNSARELSRAIQSYPRQDVQVACLSDYQQGIAFYTHRRVTLVGDDRDELDFGSRQGDNAAWFPTLPEFAAQWDSGKPFLVVVKKGELAKFQAACQRPGRLIMKAGNRLLLANDQPTPAPPPLPSPKL